MLVRVLNHLGIKSLHAIAGGSYGGMVALAFGERHPERVGHLLSLVLPTARTRWPLPGAACNDRSCALLSTAAARKEGLQLARALAMSTYRSSEEFSARFTGAPVLDAERFVFPVEELPILAWRRLRDRVIVLNRSFVYPSPSICIGWTRLAFSYRRRPSRFAKINSFHSLTCAQWLRACRWRVCTKCPRSTATMHS